MAHHGESRNAMRLFALALLLLAVVLTACGSDPVPTPTPVTPPPAPTMAPTPAPEPTLETVHAAPTAISGPTTVPTPTPALVPSPEPGPMPTEVVPTATATPSPFAHLDIDIDADTVWRDLIGDLYRHERSCVRAVPDGLDQPVLSNDDYATEWEVAMFACLEPGTARAVLLGAMVATFEDEDGIELSESEVACVRDKLGEMDAAAVVAAMAPEPEDPLPAGAFMAGFLQCSPDWFLSALIGGEGVGLPELDEGEADCAREVIAGVTAELMVATMQDEESPEAAGFFFTLLGCVPSLFSWDEEHPSLEDDHAGVIEGASVVEVGQSLVAMTDYDYDVDFFAFVAEEGTVYRVAVEPGTLEDAWLELHGPFPDYELEHTAYAYEQEQPISLLWQAPHTDMVYVSVYGVGTGDYAFSVDAVDVDDDHANITGRATPFTIEQEMRGNLDYLGDVDVFRLEAEEGMVYQLDVHLLTLEDSFLTVEDSRGERIAYNDDHQESLNSLVLFKASEPDAYFIFVEGYGVGAYTLLAKAWEENHGDSSETATATPGPSVTTEREVNWSSPDVGEFVAVDSTQNHACGLLSDGRVICWGDHYSGQSTPPDERFKSITTGATHTCGLKDGGEILCWGDEYYGNIPPPEILFSSIDAGSAHTCGVQQVDGKMVCWGYSANKLSTPPYGEFVSVSSGGAHSCGLKTDGSVVCWGENGSKQSSAPNVKFKSVSAGAGHSCGITLGNTVLCWGGDWFGQARPPAGTFKYVSAGEDHSCGLLEGGKAVCWGSNEGGKSTPPPGLFSTVVASQHGSCGVDGRGLLACWGHRYHNANVPPNSATGVGGTMSDDGHGDTRDTATLLVIGQEVKGMVNNQSVPDYFELSAREGHLYHVYTELGTLEDSWLQIIDREGQVEYGDDFGNDLAARLYWEAPASGNYWIVVGGFGEGTYTLVVEEFLP